jgi:hypothetical protein
MNTPNPVAPPVELLETVSDLLVRAYTRDGDAPPGWLEAAVEWRRQCNAYLQGAAEPDASELPEGEYARVEIMGHDDVTGWVTDGTRAGTPVMVVRGWDGQVLREVPGHALYQFFPLATPLKRPDPPAAIEVGPHSAAVWLDEAGTGGSEPDGSPEVDDDLGPEVDDRGGMTDYRHDTDDDRFLGGDGRPC